MFPYIAAARKRKCFWDSTLCFILIRDVAKGIVNVRVVQMGDISLGVVAIRVINDSNVGMGIFSTRITIMELKHGDG